MDGSVLYVSRVHRILSGLLLQGPVEGHIESFLGFAGF